MTNQTNEERDLAFIESETDPSVRYEVARGIVQECRQITLRRIASASRENNSQLLKHLEGEQKKYTDALQNLIDNGVKATDTIECALTAFARFVRTNKRNNNLKPPENDGLK